MSLPPWRQMYDRIAPIIVALLAVLAVAALVGTYVNTQADHRQDVQRDMDQDARQRDQKRASEQQAHLLQCFDDFATQLAGGLPPVRAATVHRDNARARWEAAQGAVSKAIESALSHVATSGADGSQLGVILAAFANLDMASERLRNANRHLAEVRAANPYPAAPSTFCAT